MQSSTPHRQEENQGSVLKDPDPEPIDAVPENLHNPVAPELRKETSVNNIINSVLNSIMQLIVNCLTVDENPETLLPLFDKSLEYDVEFAICRLTSAACCLLSLWANARCTEDILKASVVSLHTNLYSTHKLHIFLFNYWQDAEVCHNKHSLLICLMNSLEIKLSTYSK